jgi:hypothetical protein
LKRRPRLGFRLWKKIAGVSKVVADKNPLEQFFPPVKRLCEAHSKCYKLIKNLDCAVAISSLFDDQRRTLQYNLPLFQKLLQIKMPWNSAVYP